MRHQRHPITTRLVQFGPSRLPLLRKTHELRFFSHVSHVILHLHDVLFACCDVLLRFPARFTFQFAAKDPMEANKVFQGSRTVNRHHIHAKDLEKVDGSEQDETKRVG